jgi:hypothetical protein
MDERPRDPNIERQEVVERREIVERDRTVARDPVDRVTVHESRGPRAAIWLIPLVIVVALLLWYVMSRGQPTQLEVPSIEAPRIESPQPDTRIEIELPERRTAPAAEPAPAAQPTQPAEPPQP